MRAALLLIGATVYWSASVPAWADFPLPHELPRQEEFPDPLVMLDGTAIKSADDWQNNRKPELKELFQHYMYGRYPAKPERVTAKVLFEESNAFGGKATLKEVELTFGPPKWPKIYLLIAAPQGGPRPCFVGLNFGGNHLLTKNPAVHVPETWMPAKHAGVENFRATAAGRGTEMDTWPLEEIVRRGYAVATFYCGDIQPDRPFVREGMLATLPESDGPGDPTASSTIMWWAWGIHRAVDYLETDEAIDSKRIAVVGHSRLGKTALVAGAFDDRLALVIPNQAGCGGTAPSRTDEPKAERIDLLNGVRPHWFCDNFKAFGAEPAKLPFDQHALVALCAPRPVLLTNAAEDVWASPPGQFKVLQAASPVYELLGEEGLAADKMPEAGAPLIDSRLGYWIRPGKHAMTPADWKVYMDFADKWLK
jgi:hypothetical protein